MRGRVNAALETRAAAGPVAKQGGFAGMSDQPTPRSMALFSLRTGRAFASRRCCRRKGHGASAHRRCRRRRQGMQKSARERAARFAARTRSEQIGTMGTNHHVIPPRSHYNIRPGGDAVSAGDGAGATVVDTSRRACWVDPSIGFIIFGHQPMDCRYISRIIRHCRRKVTTAPSIPSGSMSALAPAASSAGQNLRPIYRHASQRSGW